MIPHRSMISHRAFSPNENFRLSPIKQIELAASKIPGVVSLAQGIPSFTTPDVIRRYVWEKIQAGACDKYSLSPGLEELREELSLSLVGEGFSYNPDSEILITAGSIEGVTATLLALTQPGDEVLLPSPTYASYLGAIYAARCIPRYVPLDEEKNFDFLPEEIEKAITKRTKVFLFCTPNNPTGTLFSEEKSQAIVEIAQRHNLILLVDEVYKDFYYTHDTHVSPATLPGARDRVIRACSFSKAYAMTGWRVGFLLGQREFISEILKYHDVMVSCAPVVSQYAAIAALRFGHEILPTFQEEYRKRRNYTLEVLDSLSEWLDYQTPKATYFAFPRLKDTVPLAHDSDRLAYELLERAKVALVPGVAFGPSGESHLRINFGRSPEDLTVGLERFGNYLSEQTIGKRWKKEGVRETLALQPAPRSSRSKNISLILQYLARRVILRERPTIIGIAGMRSKTTWKRLVVSLLSKKFQVEYSPLSYNTPVGLPLSVLGLTAPRTRKDRLTFPFRAIQAALKRNLRERVLVLEYGPASREEALELLSVAVPDWLLVTGALSAEPNLDRPALREAIRELVQRVEPSKILYRCDDDAMFSSVDEPLPAENALTTDYLKKCLLSEEYVGSGARFGALASAELGKKLGLEEADIAYFLSGLRSS